MRPGDRGWVRHPDDGEVVEVEFIGWMEDGDLSYRVIGRERETIYLSPDVVLAAAAEEVCDAG